MALLIGENSICLYYLQPWNPLKVPCKVPHEGAELMTFASSSASCLQGITSHHGSYTTWTRGRIRMQRFACPPTGTRGLRLHDNNFPWQAADSGECGDSKYFPCLLDVHLYFDVTYSFMTDRSLFLSPVVNIINYPIRNWCLHLFQSIKLQARHCRKYFLPFIHTERGGPLNSIGADSPVLSRFKTVKSFKLIVSCFLCEGRNVRARLEQRGCCQGDSIQVKNRKLVPGGEGVFLDS